MARLKITKVKYSGKLYYFESPPLGDGVNLISGLNGSGKTTFCDFIYYGLGGVVSQFDPDGKERHKEIASDSDNFVELEVLLNNKEFKLKRFIGNNEIAIESKDNSIGIYPLYRQGLTKGNELFSDWFLDQLGFEIVTIYQGTISSKINITDLMRLIYHDQAPDPKKIYKDAVNSNYVSNSLEVRKAIFEILVGKLFQEYYTSYSNFRETEKLRDEQKYALKQFRNAVVKFKQYETESNLVFLTKELEEKRNQLKNLQQYRKSLRKRPLKKDASYREIEDLKVKNQEIILQLETYRKNKANFYYELSRLKNLQSETILEVIQITKIIQTHEKLKLFMPDTCPYCLNKVEREEGKCVCGNIVEESQYERFFYNEKEYYEIIKTKQKNVETIDTAIKGLEKDLQEIIKNENEINVVESNLRKKITSVLNEMGDSINLSEIDATDEKIIELNSTIDSIGKQIELERIEATYRDELSITEERFKDIKILCDGLLLSAKKEMKGQVAKFNKKYNELMLGTVRDFKEAHLDEDYMPIINDGEYREASMGVPKRLMYFLTLFYISLNDSTVKFPKFLLIDTPDTAGIDADNLINSIEKIDNVFPGQNHNDGQIILTIGPNKYPKQMDKYRLMTLDKNNLLLKRKQ